MWSGAQTPPTTSALARHHKSSASLKIQHVDNIADHMMKNGVGMFHQLASWNTTENLPNYLLQHNEHVSEGDIIEVEPNEYQVTYALDPAKDPAMEDFLSELTSHELLKSTLQFLTGDDDPAITEGAQPQTWHHDGITEYSSAVQFAHTYSHIYILFVALQDTTAAMGGTKVCPGMHYCGVNQWSVCEQHGFTLPSWNAGTGLPFNQQLAHAA
jgi:hypothetical protein